MRLSLLLFPAWASALTYSSNICITKYGGNSVSPVPTSNTTVSKGYTATIKSTTTKTSTVTASAVSKTRTTFTKSTSTIYKTTDTFSTTSTEYDTSTVYEPHYTTFYGTTTYTTTSYLSTTTAPTTPGFIPIKSYMSTEGYSPAKRDVAKTSSAQYPTKVSCTAKIQDITVVKSTVSTTVATTTTPTSTVFVTSTVVVTAFRGTASTTITATTTSTVTTTNSYTLSQYVTYTSTETAVGPVGTAYAACTDPENYLQKVDGYYISGFAFPYYGQDSTEQPTSANECCTAAAAGGYAAWYMAYNVRCYLLIARDCQPDFYVADLIVDKRETDHNSTAGNGNCGRYRYWSNDDLRG